MEKIEGFLRDTFVYKDDNSFLYLKNKDVGSKSYYKCHEDDCKATCIADEGGSSVFFNRAHQHMPNEAKLDHLRFLALLRELSATTTDSFKSIFSKATRMHQRGAVEAGSFWRNVDIMDGARKKALPKIPKSLSELNAIMDDQQ